MKRIGITLLIMLMTMGVSAQRGESGQRGSKQGNTQRMSPQQRSEKELTELTKVLSLTDKQVIAITKLQEGMSKEIETKRETMTEGSDRKAMRTEMDALRKKYNTDVEALLSDEQKVKYAAYLKKREEQMKKRQGQGQGQGQRQGGQRGEGGGGRSN